MSSDAAEPIWHALSSAEVLAALQSDAAVGLTKAEAAARVERYGRNALTAAKARTLLHMIWDNAANIITLVLAAAAVIAGIFQEWVELGFITAVIVLNIAIGVVQEGKAEAATRAIAQMGSATALVVREGRKRALPADLLVPGDIVYLSEGDRVPADLRLLDCSSLAVSEAMLTGESHHVQKEVAAVAADAQLADRGCIAFSGTLVAGGQGCGVVIRTGDAAEMGRISKLMAGVKAAPTPLLVQLEGFGRMISVICVFMAVLTFVIAYWARGEPLQEAFAAGVGVAVAMIPEGLGTIVTIALALGVQAMARSHAIVRQLPAVETLGALTVICSDKTGTLTAASMTALAVHTPGRTLRVTGTGYSPEGEVKAADGAPLEVPTVEALRQLLLPAALTNDATLMPLLSAHAQHMLTTEPMTLPQLAVDAG